MISAIQMTGIKYELDTTIKKYITKKIGRLDRYLPRHARKSVHAEVIVKQIDKSHGNKYETEVIMHLPDQILTAKDSTVNALAAIDIVEAKIMAQIRKYKNLKVDHRGRHNLLGKFKRGFSRDLNISS